LAFFWEISSITDGNFLGKLDLPKKIITITILAIPKKFVYPISKVNLVFGFVPLILRSFKSCIWKLDRGEGVVTCK
jgi:hypothetical protein